jgi:riboflavin synthase
MFTGLVEAIGELTERTVTAAGYRLRISTSLAPELTLGGSLAVNGVCLTVVAVQDGDMFADVGPETARVTTLGSISTGAAVNLERPLRADGRLGGHFVQGHVDAVGRIEDLRPDAEFLWLTVSFPPPLARLLVNKGSVAVDGISLTVAGLSTDRFTVQIVPYTMDHTNVGRMQLHDPVNLECDMVGKYVARSVELAGTLSWPEAPASKDLP